MTAVPAQLHVLWEHPRRHNIATYPAGSDPGFFYGFEQHFTMEYIDDLQINGYRIIQSDRGFKFGMDAVLLSDFAARGGDPEAEYRSMTGRCICDLGTGTGILPILLAAKTGCLHITGVELQPEMAEMAERSVRLNGLEDRITIICGDIRELRDMRQTQDLVTMNPPYMKSDSGLASAVPSVDDARHENNGTIEDFVRAAALLLKQGGAMYAVYRPDRLTDLLTAMRKHAIEPKVLRTVVPRLGREPNIILVKGVRGGGPCSLKMPPEMVVYEQNGSTYTPELKRIYNV